MIRKLLFFIVLITPMYSCSDDENRIDKDQLTLGIWYYENAAALVTEKSRTLNFKPDGTYTSDLEFHGSTNITTKEGSWFFDDHNVIDLTGFGSCVQPVGAPPCTPPDVDLKIIQLTKELLVVEELINGKRTAPANTTRYVNIK